MQDAAIATQAQGLGSGKTDRIWPTPRLRFMVGGVQKGGTTALARYLANQPGIALPAVKEAHLFDDPDYDTSWTAAEVDQRLAHHFGDAGGMWGDATPITMLSPRVIERVHRYNPAMLWILLLRDPMQRAVSHHHMERSRGRERRGLAWALLAERIRLAGHAEDLGWESPLRHYSYRLRGDYASQLDALFALFPKHQVLLLRSADLASAPEATLARTCEFLGVPAPPAGERFEPVFVGNYRAWPPGNWRWRVLRWWFRRELRDMDTRYGITWDEGSR